MKKVVIVATTITLLLVVTGCQGQPPVEKAGFQTTASDDAGSSNVVEPVQTENLAESWAQSLADAPSIATDLMSKGICEQIDYNEFGAYGGDMLTMFDAGTYIMCRNWPSSVKDPSTLKCAATYYITTGAENLFDPKRELLYEDGMSVALYYSDEYQVEVSPQQGAMLETSEVLSRCSSIVAQADETIGGAVNHYGDYSSSFSGSDNSGAGTDTYVPEPPVSETVSMPNLVGTIDGQADNWLRNKGYKFYSDIKSTGFNAKISCMMSGNNIIVDQNPRAGTMVQNLPSKMVTFFVDCEW